MRLLLDTNVIIRHLQDGEPLPEWGTRFVISVITEAEILRHPNARAADLRKIEAWLATVEIIPVDSIIARRAAKIGKTRKTKLPDLLIAATALELNIPLVTSNNKDFKGISNLQVESTF